MAMNILEEAVIYATIMHQGKVRKIKSDPYILHPLEVAQIISTMTDDVEVITAGVLHDIVEDTDGTLEEIRSRFGKRVAELVATETENKYRGESAASSWRRRKEESLKGLKNSTDEGVHMLWLGDKLSNIRSLDQLFGELGNSFWDNFNMSDPAQQLWYYRSIAEELELTLNKTGAFKEFVNHINHIWPGTFESEKTKYRKYKECSVDGCKVIGSGAKGKVYRYNDEVVVKVYNENNTFRDIEKEIYLSRQAFIAGIPTAISFGIVSVGNQYGAMFELLETNSLSQLIAKSPDRVEYFAGIMADIALQIHNTPAFDSSLPNYMTEVGNWIDGGIALVDDELTARVREFCDSIPRVETMIHGDFHTGNVLIQNGEPLLIDMDRLSVCHPIVEISGLYMFYVGFGEINPEMIEDFMGFSCDTAKAFFMEFLKKYYQTEDENALQIEIDRAALLTYTRLVRRVYKKGSDLSIENAIARDYYIDKIRELIEKVKPY